jgi:hypothetical protein
MFIYIVITDDDTVRQITLIKQSITTYIININIITSILLIIFQCD